jgi:hypothetical protein
MVTLCWVDVRARSVGPKDDVITIIMMGFPCNVLKHSALFAEVLFSVTSSPYDVHVYQVSVNSDKEICLAHTNDFLHGTSFTV